MAQQGKGSKRLMLGGVRMLQLDKRTQRPF